MGSIEHFHPSADAKAAVLNDLVKYLRPDQIGIVRPAAFAEIVARPHGPNTRLFLSRHYAGMPDLDIPTPLWEKWHRLAQRCDPGDDVFSRHELEVARRSAGIALSDLEPHKRFYGHRPGVMELWTGMSSFVDLIDEACSEEIGRLQATASNLWHENAITGTILERLEKDFAGTAIELRSGRRINFHFAGYKMRGANEKANGDITFFVVRDDGDGAKFTGLGYVEMKRRNDDGDFAEISELQLHRILRHVPNALVGLQETDSGAYEDCVQVGPKNGRVAILPVTQVIERPNHIKTMLRFSTTLGHQIGVRYLNGADLILNEELALAALSYTKSTYIVIVTGGRNLTIEEVIERNPDVKRKLENLENIRIAMERVRGGGRTA